MSYAGINRRRAACKGPDPELVAEPITGLVRAAADPANSEGPLMSPEAEGPPWVCSLVIRGVEPWRPRQDSNLRTRLRRPMLYPLSYEGSMDAVAC